MPSAVYVPRILILQKYIYAQTASIFYHKWTRKLTAEDIEWRSGGYIFVAYDAAVEASLKSLLAVQKSFGLNIDWYAADQILQYARGCNQKACWVAPFLLKTARLHRSKQ